MELLEVLVNVAGLAISRRRVGEDCVWSSSRSEGVWRTVPVNLRTFLCQPVTQKIFNVRAISI